MKQWLRFILPVRYVWVEWKWGTIRLYKADRMGTTRYFYDRSDNMHLLEVPNHDHEIKRWAYYRHWWQRKLPAIEEDSEYTIKINERARPVPDGRFPSPRTLS